MGANQHDRRSFSAFLHRGRCRRPAVPRDRDNVSAGILEPHRQRSGLRKALCCCDGFGGRRAKEASSGPPCLVSAVFMAYPRHSSGRLHSISSEGRLAGRWPRPDAIACTRSGLLSWVSSCWLGRFGVGCLRSSRSRGSSRRHPGSLGVDVAACSIGAIGCSRFGRSVRHARMKEPPSLDLPARQFRGHSRQLYQGRFCGLEPAVGLVLGRSQQSRSCPSPI